MSNNQGHSDVTLRIRDRVKAAIRAYATSTGWNIVFPKDIAPADADPMDGNERIEPEPKLYGLRLNGYVGLTFDRLHAQPVKEGEPQIIGEFIVEAALDDIAYVASRAHFDSIAIRFRVTEVSDDKGPMLYRVTIRYAYFCERVPSGNPFSLPPNRSAGSGSGDPTPLTEAEQADEALKRP